MTPAETTYDTETVANGLSILHPAGDVFELRMFNLRKPNGYVVSTISGYFDDPAKAAAALRPYVGAVTIYQTLNRINPALLARAHNRLIERPKATTADTDITRRLWLPIDTDPVRPSKISATDAELGAALDRLDELVAYHLEEWGWQPAITAMSGNGGHALYRIDLPNDDESTHLVQGVLGHLAERFDDDVVKVDTSVYTAGRVWKVYGTTARKGDPLPDRPHRRAEITHHDEDAPIITADLLRALVPMSKRRQNSSNGATGPSAGRNGYTEADLGGALDALGVTYRKKTDTKGRTIFALGECLTSDAHTDGAAVTLEDGKAGYICHHNSCATQTWQDVKPLLFPSDNGSGPTAGGAREPGDELPSIVVTSRHVRDISGEAYQVLVAANEPPVVYQYAGALARVTTAGDRPTVELLDANTLRHRLNRVGNYHSRRMTENGPVFTPVNAPSRLVNDILAYPEWPELPALEGVVTAPVVAPTGDVRLRPGYDADTRLVYMPIGGLSLEDTDPAPARVAWAKDTIDELLCDFPFRDAASKANAISLLLLAFARPIIDGSTPLHSITAPTPGTGKSLLAEVVSRPFHPDGPLVMAAGKDEDEWRKRITSVLAGGISHVQIDNIKTPLVSGSLASVLTARLWTDRVLGTNNTVTLPNRQVWIATGNNVVIDSELARRCCWIRLDAGEERPWLREDFKHPNLLEWAGEHRGELVTAALVLVRNWFAEGRPAGQRAVGSFEAWARVMGGILDAAGIPGFMDNADELYESADPAAALWSAFAKAWWKEFQDKPVGTSDLFPLADSEPAKDETGAGILDDLLGGGSPRSRKIRLGKLLAQRVDQVLAGYKVIDDGTKHRARQFKLQPLGLDGAEVL